MKKMLSGILSAVMCVGVIAGGTVPVMAEERVVTIYSSKDAWKDQCAEAAKRIEETYGIKADVVAMPNTDIESVIATKLATNDPPDIIFSNVPQTVEQYNITEKGEILDEEPWVERLAAKDVLTYKDGHIYGMPTYVSGNFFGGVYYNKEKMKELGYDNPQPKTMDEFWAILEDIKSQGVTPVYMTDADPWTTQVWTTMGWGVVLDEKKDTIYNDLLTNKIRFTDIPEMEEVLQGLQDIYTKGYANENHASQTYDTSMAVVGEGEYPMVIQGEWFEIAMNDAYPDVELGSFAIPFGDKDMIAIGAYTEGAYVPKGENSELAKEYLRYWSSPEILGPVFESYPCASAWVDVDGGDLLPAQKNLIENYVNTGKYTYEFDAYFDVARPIMEDYLFRNIVEVTMGKEPAEAIKDWDERYNEFMRDKEIEGFN
ncbi:ABC transporter substrate-binding protein [Blautia schinkii]|nr:ABC transporter substrate-binding protein [Blautia schinkii]